MKRRSMQNAQFRVGDLCEEARLRGFTCADVFGAFAQTVADRNPMLARMCLDAVEQVVRRRIPTVAAGPAVAIERH